MLVIVGILSVVAIASFSGRFTSARGFYDELLSQVQYARKAAIAQRRPVFVRIDGAQSRLCYSTAGACTGADGVASPGGGVPFSVSIPAGVGVTAANFAFDGLGRYAAAAPLTITVTGDGSLSFTVEHETGYVRP